MADLKTDIEQTAKNPQRASVDGQSVDAQPVRDQIEADRYLASKAAAKDKKRGLRISKLTPPPTV